MDTLQEVLTTIDGQIQEAERANELLAQQAREAVWAEQDEAMKELHAIALDAGIPAAVLNAAECSPITPAMRNGYAMRVEAPGLAPFIVYKSRGMYPFGLVRVAGVDHFEGVAYVEESVESCSTATQLLTAARLGWPNWQAVHLERANLQAKLDAEREAAEAEADKARLIEEWAAEEAAALAEARRKHAEQMRLEMWGGDWPKRWARDVPPELLAVATYEDVQVVGLLSLAAAVIRLPGRRPFALCNDLRGTIATLECGKWIEFGTLMNPRWGRLLERVQEPVQSESLEARLLNVLGEWVRAEAREAREEESW
jgi:hypothetical protein